MTPAPPLPLRRGVWAAAGSVALLLAVPLLLLLPALVLGKMVAGWDYMTLGQPLHQAVQRSLAAHEWPLWLPDIFCGMPGVASCNLYFAYPTAMAGELWGLTLHQIVAWDAALHIALAGVGMFLFLRRLERSVAAALLGALFFQVSGSEISQLNGGFQNFVEGTALVPWVFWAAHRALAKGSWFSWGLCGLFLGLQGLAGAAQLCAYTFAAMACFVWFFQPDGAASPAAGRRIPALAGLGAALLIAFLVAAPQLWPTLQYLPLAERSGYSQAQFMDGSISLPEGLAWLVPGFFGWKEPTYDGPMSLRMTTDYLGLLPWGLAAAAVAALWKRERMVRWLAGLGLAALFLAQRDWTPFYWLFSHLPIVRGFRFWSRILFLVALSASGLAAYGWDALSDGLLKKRALAGAAGFTGLALAAAGLAYALAAQRAAVDHSTLHNLPPGTEPPMTGLVIAMARASALETLGLLPLMAGVLWLASRRFAAALVLALAFHAMDQGQVAAHFIHFCDPDPPALQGRLAGLAPAPAGAEPYRVADAGFGSNRLMLMGYEGLGGQNSMKMLGFMRVSVALHGRFQEWLDLFNIRYRVLKPVSDVNEMRLAANPGAYPRAWLVGRCRVAATDDAAAALLADPGFDPRREVALAADPGLDAADPQGTVTWLARSPGGETLDVVTAKESVLVLSNSWYPSWRCRVDGVDGALLKADGGLQAVALKAGRHRLEFRFDPWLFNAALAAAAAGLALLLGLGLAGRRRRRRGISRFS